MSDFFFNKDAEVRVTRGKLPHWEQGNSTYFITFSVGDSLPKPALLKLKDLRRQWLMSHGITTQDHRWRDEFRRLPASLQNQFRWHSLDLVDRYLDNSLGSCPLGRSEVAESLATTILHYNNIRFHVPDLVIMPNHVHLLVFFPAQHDMRETVYQWKRLSAMEINRILGQNGRFWQSENFDHLVRCSQAFFKYRDYIADNPRKAGLHMSQVYYRKDTQVFPDDE